MAPEKTDSSSSTSIFSSVGILEKMETEHSSPVSYFLTFEKKRIRINDFIGKKIHLQSMGAIYCLNCGDKTPKSFAQGYCFVCFQTLARCDLCIMKPETCHFHLGTCREPDWANGHCFIPHVVYLANSSGIKVGITREKQMTTRWMDQGAVQARPLVRVKSRRDAGLVECALKQWVPDKTNWRALLKGIPNRLDMEDHFQNLGSKIPKDIETEVMAGQSPYEFQYPVTRYPEKVSSYNLDKNPYVEAYLEGIKGQYWILTGGVLNIRKFGGYRVQLSVEY